MHLPAPRGPLSNFIVEELRRPPHDLGRPPGWEDDPLMGHDFQLALYICYELHYRGFDEADEAWEWEPSLIAFRRMLEGAFERALLDQIPLRTEVDDVP